jgi:hypothetical protein
MMVAVCCTLYARRSGKSVLFLDLTKSSDIYSLLV